MKTKVRAHMVFWAVGVIAIAGLVSSTLRIQNFRYRPYLHETLYLPSGKFVKELSLGYREIVADIVWFSAIQYYGDFRQGNHNLAYFQGLIDIVTALDPHFIFAYIFGAIVVSEDGGDFTAGIDILRRGIANNPRSWRLPFELGFLSYVNRYDYDLAARYFDLSSRMPAAPDRAKRFAAFVYSKAGKTASAVQLWEQYKEYAQEEWLKEMCDRYIEKIKQGKSIHGKLDDDR